MRRALERLEVVSDRYTNARQKMRVLSEPCPFCDLYVVHAPGCPWRMSIPIRIRERMIFRHITRCRWPG